MSTPQNNPVGIPPQYGQAPVPPMQPMPGQAQVPPMLPQYGQPGAVPPMVGQNGQVGQGQYPGQQMNPMPPQYGQQPMAGHYEQQAPQKKNPFVTVIKDNYTTISLFEYSAGYDPTEEYPKAFGFIMGVPSVSDQTKKSGKRYVPDQKIVMKFSTQEMRALGQCMLDIAIFKQAIPPFEKFSDPSKNAHGGNAQAGATKAFKMSYDQGKNNIIINMTYGQLKVFIPIKDLQDTRGLGLSLINCGNFADQKLAEYIMANHIRNDVPDEVPEHIMDEMASSNQQYVQQQYAPAAQYTQPQAAQPQYTPEQIAYFQAQQVHAGYPGAQ